MKRENQGWLWPELRTDAEDGDTFVITAHCPKCDDYTQQEHRKIRPRLWGYRCLQCHPYTPEEHAEAKRKMAYATGANRPRFGDASRLSGGD